MKKSAVVGRVLVRILSIAIIPEILQFNNGSEFLGKYIDYIKKYFGNINIVKGRPHRPQTQGSVEKSNRPFKRALEKWMVENPDEGWYLVGIYVVNAQINTRPTENKATRSAYEIYYGKHTSATASYILDSDLLKKATTEYSLTAVQEVMELVEKKDPKVLITFEEVHKLMIQADGSC